MSGTRSSRTIDRLVANNPSPVPVATTEERIDQHLAALRGALATYVLRDAPPGHVQAMTQALFQITSVWSLVEATDADRAKLLAIFAPYGKILDLVNARTKAEGTDAP